MISVALLFHPGWGLALPVSKQWRNKVLLFSGLYCHSMGVFIRLCLTFPQIVDFVHCVGILLILLLSVATKASVSLLVVFGSRPVFIGIVLSYVFADILLFKICT